MEALSKRIFVLNTNLTVVLLKFLLCQYCVLQFFSTPIPIGSCHVITGHEQAGKFIKLLLVKKNSQVVDARLLPFNYF